MAPSNPTAAGLIPRAEEIHKTAIHYDNFRVGCSAMAENGEFYHGANVKPTKDAEPRCAEKPVLEAAAERGTFLTTVVVLGKPRPEDRTATLHCCEERCFPMLKNYYRQGKAVRRDTHFAFVNAETGQAEEFTLEELFKSHGKSLDD